MTQSSPRAQRTRRVNGLDSALRLKNSSLLSVALIEPGKFFQSFKLSSHSAFSLLFYMKVFPPRFQSFYTQFIGKKESGLLLGSPALQRVTDYLSARRKEENHKLCFEAQSGFEKGENQHQKADCMRQNFDFSERVSRARAFRY